VPLGAAGDSGTEGMSGLIMNAVGGVKFGAIYALAAVGLVAIHKATRIVNFAHGGLVMLGAFGAYLVVVRYELPYWLAYIAVPIAIGGFAALLEATVLKALRKADLFAVLVATIFLGIVLSESYRLAYNTEILAVPSAVVNAPLFLGDVVITREQIWVSLGALACGLSGFLLFRYARTGRSMRAMASNVRGAQLCGYSVDGVYALAWFFGGVLAGLAGVFTAPSTGVSPELAVSTVTAAFVAAAIGGFDSVGGALLGGLILGIVETLAAAYVSSAAKSAISFLLLFAVLLWRPDGLFPERKVRRV
jgi:branched-chain amino acid transport system permease protein